MSPQVLLWPRRTWLTNVRQSTRGDILLYLFVHLLAYKSSQDEGRVVVSNSWTEYIKFLPREILVPTLWTAPERSLLEGTSLEVGLQSQRHGHVDHCRTTSTRALLKKHTANW